MLELEIEVRLVRWREDRSEGMVRADVMVMEVPIMVMMRRQVMKGRSMFLEAGWMSGREPFGTCRSGGNHPPGDWNCGRRVRNLGL